MASSAREEVEGQKEGAKTDTGPEITESDGREGGTSWPQASKMNATLQIPSFKKADPLVSRGGYTFQKKRPAWELVREKKDPSEHVGQSSRVDFPLEGKAHLPQDVLEAARFIAGNESDAIEAFWGRRVEQLKEKATRCSKATER